MAIAQRILDRYIERRAFLIRYENSVARDVLASMRRGEEQALGAIASAHADFLAAGGDPNEWSGEGVKLRRRALRRVRAALDDVFPEARKSLRVALEELAQDEAEAFADILADSMPDDLVDELELSSVPERQLAQIVDNQFAERLEGTAARYADAFEEVGDAAMRRVNAALVDGVRDGRSTDSIVAAVRRVVGVGENSPTRRDAVTLVRTSIQTTANDVAAQAYRENDDIVKAEDYVATLDDRTCPICGPLDGTTHPLTMKTTPRPPRHPNCRCFKVPVMKTWREMGFPDTLSDQAKELFNGRPAERRTWGDWVQANPDRLRNVLGPRRAELLERGDMRLTDLTNTRDALTLKEIKARVQRRERRAAA